MSVRRPTVIVVGVAVGIGTWTGPALADSSGNSDPAHLCLDGPQWDYYTFSGQEAGDPGPLDFGTLDHGIDRSGEVPLTYVVTTDHGQCVSFFAMNKKSGKSGKVSLSDLHITKVVDKSSPVLF